MIKSFTDYLKEQEENEINQEQEEFKSKIIALFTDGEPATIEKVQLFADELEMEKEELEKEIYNIFSEILMAKAEEEKEVNDEVEDDVDLDETIYESNDIDKLEKEKEKISKEIEELPLKSGNVDFENPKFKKLSNKRAKLADKIRQLKGKVEENIEEDEQINEVKNQDVIKMFVDDTFPKDKKSSWGTANLKIVKQPNGGWSLVNYATALLYRSPDGKLIYNDTKYSPTTSKIQTYIRGELGDVDYDTATEQEFGAKLY